MGKFSVNGQIVLISGGSQGLGESFAKKFVQEGDNVVVIISRSQGNLEKACNRIAGEAVSLRSYETDGEVKLLYHACDASDYGALEELFDLLKAKCLLPDQVYMCAGGSIPKLFLELSPAELSSGILTNYSTAANLAHVSLRNNVPHLLFFSSEVAFFPFIGYSQYAPLKQSIRALVSILRQEHRDKRITCVFPGNFQSEGYDIENETKPSITRKIEGPSHPITASECRDKIISSLKWGLDDITTDFIGWILMACDQGFNKHGIKQFMFPVAWVLGAILNLLVVPAYMMICSYQIKQWKRKTEQK